MSTPDKFSVHANRMQCANSIIVPNTENDTEGRQASNTQRAVDKVLPSEPQDDAQLGSELDTQSDAVENNENAADANTKGAERGKANNIEDMAQKEALMQLARKLEFWHGPNGDAYVTIPRLGNILVKNSDFRDWLAKRFWDARSQVPSRNGLDEVINTLAGRARFDGPEHPVFVRVAEHEGAVYLDRGGKDLSVVRITANGWEVSREVPVKFIRPNGLKELPEPVQGGSIEELRPFINVDDDDAFKLVVGCLVGYLSPRGPYPILILDGEQGSAKTTTTRLLRSLIDPHVGANSGNAVEGSASPRHRCQLALHQCLFRQSIFGRLGDGIGLKAAVAPEEVSITN